AAPPRRCARRASSERASSRRTGAHARATTWRRSRTQTRFGRAPARVPDQHQLARMGLRQCTPRPCRVPSPAVSCGRRRAALSDRTVVGATVTGQPPSDGAAVGLPRVIGTPALPELDPFLLLDEFKSDRPDDSLAGFPDHPHRGFETVTYMLAGSME